MIMFSTQTEVVGYLVAQGTHKGLAKAIVREYLYYSENDADDLLSRFGENDERIIVSLNEAEAYEFWLTNGDDDFKIEVVDGLECITFDGEPMCDLEGNFL